MSTYTHVCLALCCLALVSCKDSSDAMAKEEWVDLLDDQHRGNWVKKIAGEKLNADSLNTISLTDSMMVVSYQNYKKWGDRFGHIFYNEKLSHYIIECEYNIDGKRMEDAPIWAGLNSGIMLHAQSPQSMTFHQWFPISLEMQFLACKDTIQNTTGNLCTPGTIIAIDGKQNKEHCINSTSPKYNHGTWVHARAEVYGDSMVNHIINGKKVFSYTDMKTVDEGLIGLNEEEGKKYIKAIHDQPLREGYIAFQAESQEIKFKKIRLLNLCGCKDKNAKNYKSYFVKHDKSKCEY